MLSSECDIIYECKFCRNIFRSLANFISHKRIYCKNTFNASSHLNFHNGDCDGFTQDITTIVQAENDFINTKVNKNGRGHEKDLSSIVERLVERERENRMMSLSNFYEQVNEKLVRDEELKQRLELQLDVVPDSKVAVYQTLKSDVDDVKKEILEINELVSDERKVLGSNGKLVDSSELPHCQVDEDRRTCKLCK